MTRSTFFLPVVLLLVSVVCGWASAQQHQHGADDSKPKPPRIFLDKSLRVVEYQLKRLDNTRLLLVERSDDDKKYLPVHEAILKRPGMARQDRELALAAIVKINQSNPVTELLSVITKLDASDKQQQSIAKQLGTLLLKQGEKDLTDQTEALFAAVNSGIRSLQTTGFAALITIGQSQRAIELVDLKTELKPSFLQSIALLENQDRRNELRDIILSWLTDEAPGNVSNGVLRSIGLMTEKPAETFTTIAPWIQNAITRRAAVRAARKIPRKFWDQGVATVISKYLVELAETTPPADRTSDDFLEAMQFADQVLNVVSISEAESLRQRLDAVVVRVILIHTVEEEMRYDVPWFAVEAGRDVQVVLKNEDLMPHNLVITMPGALQEIALEGAAVGPTIGASGKQYVPVSDKILQATRMVPSEQLDRLTFRAPSKPGEYPYVCTFPGHWMRMYGVMVVVEDLADFQRNPVEPKDPIGLNRAFVRSWNYDDLDDQLVSGLRGRTESIGKKIFAEATCAQCHIVAGEGKAVGPELTDVWSRWKGDTAGIFREIVEPSHKIEPKYVVRKIVTIDGQVVSGIVMAEDSKTVSILPNPESLEPTVLQKDDIEEMMNSAVSIMPKGLMDRFTADEIFELIAYLKSSDPQIQK